MEAQPFEHMSENLKKTFLEAAQVFPISPRASAVLLRLAFEQLCDENKANGDTIKKRIDRLIEKVPDSNIKSKVEKFSKLIKNIGNHGAHNLELNPNDHKDDVRLLFDIFNYICEEIHNENKPIELFEKYVSRRSKGNVEKTK